MLDPFLASSRSSVCFLPVLRRLLLILSVVIGCSTASAGDDRFGFATHFGQGWPNSPTMQAIVSSGVSYIRDDLNSWDWEPTTPGVYTQPAWAMGWLKAANANGLKVVAILGRNNLYADKYDPVATGNLAAYIAKTGLVSAFEITNEPNNAYASVEGSTWQTKLVLLSNTVAAAVHAVNPSIQVIGFGAQGGQIFNMLAAGTIMDGVVYHPYAFAGSVPETTYEWQYLDYTSWIQVLSAKTTLPKWETEWGIGTSSTFSNANQANYIARRLLQESGLGVEHSFIYEFQDNATEYYGVDSNPSVPKAAFYVVQRIISALAGVKGGACFVTVNSVANGDLTDVKAYEYQGLLKTVVSSWFGNHDPRTSPPASTCSLTFTLLHPQIPQPTSYVMNSVTGTQVPLTSYTCSQTGNQFTVAGLPITDQPLMIVLQ